MKSTGITRPVDGLGRVVLPKELREKFGIAENDSVEIYVEKEYIILKKHVPGCVFCGETSGTIRYQDKLVCRKCVEKLARTAGEEA